MGEVDPISVYEQLLDDDDLKDVTIEFENGTLRAHACVLSSASEAIKGILRNGTARESKTLSWREHDVTVGRFFLRLLYTGCVEERDWANSSEEAREGTPNASARAAVPVKGVEVETRCFSPPSICLTTTPSSGRASGSTPTFYDGNRVRVVRDTTVCVMGGNYRHIVAGTIGTIAGGGKSVIIAPGLGSTSGGVLLDSLKGNLEIAEPRPPMHLLLGGIALAKVYQFPTLMGALTAAIKRRLSVKTFDEICRSAIRDDIQVLRYHCMRFADSESVEARELRELHTAGRLSPEVVHELDGLWRQEPCKPSKRRRLL